MKNKMLKVEINLATINTFSLMAMRKIGYHMTVRGGREISRKGRKMCDALDEEMDRRGVSYQEYLDLTFAVRYQVNHGNALKKEGAK